MPRSALLLLFLLAGVAWASHSPSSAFVFLSPVYAVVQDGYWTTEQFLTPNGGASARSSTIIPTSVLNRDSSSEDDSEGLNVGGMIVAIGLSFFAAIVILFLIGACLFYCTRSKPWSKFMHKYDRHVEPDVDERLDEYGELDTI